jgi:hypothetical protein
MTPAKFESGAAERRSAVDRLHSELASVNLVPLEQGLANEMPVRDLRRGGKRREDDHVGLATLVEVDEVWLWEEGMVTRAGAGRRGSQFISLFGGTPVTTVKFEKLGRSQIASTLESLDKLVTPNPGLREYRNGVLMPNAVPSGNGRILLFIHGTFSSNDNLVAELNATEEGRLFLAAAVNEAGGARTNYDQVLTFDHYTVSRSPVLNALELARMLAASDADVDVICHSRGGLVTRWFLEVFDHRRRKRVRAVLVGSPLRGTSLAAPDRLRNGVNLFTNMGRVLGKGISLIPFGQVAGSLVQVMFSLGNLASKTPMIDAAVAMIPGLAAMSRIDNNFELDALKNCSASPPEYFAVTSEYRGEEYPFWKMFCNFKLRAAEGLDRLVFTGANDLVVDTKSMTEYGLGAQTKVFAFDEGRHVYHTIYFQQADTLKFIRSSLGIV